MSDEMMSGEDAAWLDAHAARWSAQGEEAPVLLKALVGELEARHRGERLQHALSMVALAAGLLIVVCSATYTLVTGGPPAVPALALLLVPPLLGYIAWAMQRRWRARQRVAAMPPARVVEMMGEELGLRADELRWGKRIFPGCGALVGVLGGLALWQQPGAATVFKLVVAGAVMIGAAYVLYVHQPRELRRDQGRHGALRAELEGVRGR
jgi:hypothetical protein